MTVNWRLLIRFSTVIHAAAELADGDARGASNLSRTEGATNSANFASGQGDNCCAIRCRSVVELSRGQTMAIAAMSHCLTRYGEATLITRCIRSPKRTNNQPGMVTGRMIKALCVVLDGDHDLRDRGLALFWRRSIRLTLQQSRTKLQKKSQTNKGRRIHLIARQIRAELDRLLHSRATIAPALPTPRAKIFAASPRAKAASSRPTAKPRPTRPGTGRGRPQMIE